MRLNADGRTSGVWKWSPEIDYWEDHKGGKLWEKEGVRKYLGTEKGLSPQSLLQPLGVFDGDNPVFTVDRVVEASGTSGDQGKLTRIGRFRKWRSSVTERIGERWRSSRMTCLGGRKGKAKTQVQGNPRTRDDGGNNVSRCARFRAAFCR